MNMANRDIFNGEHTCKDCLEITRSQKRCPTCDRETKTIKTSAFGKSAEYYGKEPMIWWRCFQCKVLWDGGRALGFACLKHGGHEVDKELERITKDIEPKEE